MLYSTFSSPSIDVAFIVMMTTLLLSKACAFAPSAMPPTLLSSASSTARSRPDIIIPTGFTPTTTRHTERSDDSGPSTTRLYSSSSSSSPSSSGGGGGLLLIDLPMDRLALPPGGFGREYVAIQLKIKGQGPYEFMVDTGLTTEFMTPHLQQILNVQTNAASSMDVVEGLAAGGSTYISALADLKDATLCSDDIGGGVRELHLPLMHAIVTDFPQEHIDPDRDVEGMIGMELLSQFDVDFDFPNGRLRLYKPGTACKTVDMKHLVEIPAVVINETGLLGIRLTTPGDEPHQPILAFLDCGSSFLAMNWKAAGLMGLPTNKKDDLYKKAPCLQAIGIDGHPIMMPIVERQLTYAGNVITDKTTHRPTGFASPPASWKPWDAVGMAVGDIPAFQTVLGDGTRPYEGPAALIGLDVLSQRRVILEAGTTSTSRARRILVGES